MMQTKVSSQERLERRLQALLASLGLRGWKLSDQGVAGRPYFAFPEKKLALFVDDCFWHGCPTCRRPLVESDERYWQKNIADHVAQDKKHNRQLRAAGWKVVRLWAHDLDKKKRPWLHDFLKDVVA